MKLRFSNEYDLAISFEANDLNTFHEQGLSALRSFRIATERRVHRGEIHKTVSWCKSGELSMSEDGKTWWSLGNVKTLSSTGPLDGARYFNPSPVTVPWIEGDSLNDIHHNDENNFVSNLEATWQKCYETYQWGQALNVVTMTLMDELDRHVRETQTGNSPDSPKAA